MWTAVINVVKNAVSARRSRQPLTLHWSIDLVRGIEIVITVSFQVLSRICARDTEEVTSLDRRTLHGTGRSGRMTTSVWYQRWFCLFAALFMLGRHESSYILFRFRRENMDWAVDMCVRQRWDRTRVDCFGSLRLTTLSLLCRSHRNIWGDKRSARWVQRAWAHGAVISKHTDDVHGNTLTGAGKGSHSEAYKNFSAADEWSFKMLRLLSCGFCKPAEMVLVLEVQRKSASRTSALQQGHQINQKNGFIVLVTKGRDICRKIYSKCGISWCDIKTWVQPLRVDSEAADFMLVAQPHIVCSGRTDTNMGHNQFTTGDVNELMSYCRDVVKHGFHGHIFYNALPYGSYCRVLT